MNKSRVRKADDVFTSDQISGKTLFVGNIDRRLTEYHLVRLFQKHGEVVRNHFLWHKEGDLRGTPRGFCFIEFATKQEAEAATAALDGKIVLGRKMVVRPAKPVDVSFDPMSRKRPKHSVPTKQYRGSSLDSMSKEQKIRALQRQLSRIEDSTSTSSNTESSSVNSHDSRTTSSKKVSPPISRDMHSKPSRYSGTSREKSVSEAAGSKVQKMVVLHTDEEKESISDQTNI